MDGSQGSPLVEQQSNDGSVRSAAPSFAGTIRTDLMYMARKDEYFESGGAPYYINYPVRDIPQNNTCHQPHSVTIRDLRQNLDALNVDVHGFKLLKSETLLTTQDFEDDDVIREKYYPEVEELLKRVLGGRRVLIWEHTPRLRRPNDEPSGVSRLRPPLLSAHIDQTPQAVKERVQRMLPDVADQILESRVQVINVWRPLAAPVNDFPLTLGDARTFDLHRDGIAVSMVFPHYVGQAIELFHHDDHRWYYVSEQQTDEVWAFKCYDSREDVVTGKEPQINSSQFLKVKRRYLGAD